MHTLHPRPRPYRLKSIKCHAALAACAVALGAALAGAAHANPDAKGLAEADARYRRDVAHCMTEVQTLTRANCLREADAAHAEARRGDLTVASEAERAANALKRCDALKGEDKAYCLQRMRGAGVVSGSVADGGVYREFKQLVPASAPAAASAANRTAPARR